MAGGEETPEALTPAEKAAQEKAAREKAARQEILDREYRMFASNVAANKGMVTRLSNKADGLISLIEAGSAPDMNKKKLLKELEQAEGHADTCIASYNAAIAKFPLMEKDMNKKIDRVQEVATQHYTKVCNAIGNFWEMAEDVATPDRRSSVPEGVAHSNHKLPKIFENMMPKTTLL